MTRGLVLVGAAGATWEARAGHDVRLLQISHRGVQRCLRPHGAGPGPVRRRAALCPHRAPARPAPRASPARGLWRAAAGRAGSGERGRVAADPPQERVDQPLRARGARSARPRYFGGRPRYFGHRLAILGTVADARVAELRGSGAAPRG